MTTKTQAKNKTGKLDVLEKTKTTKTVYIKRYSQKGKKKISYIMGGNICKTYIS